MSPSDESAQPTFEISLAELEAIVHDLEEGHLGLAEALARYEEGVKHLKNCYQLLQDAERKIELLTGITEEGTPRTQPFVEESTEQVPQRAGRRKRPRPTEPSAIPLPGMITESEPRDIDGQRPPS